MTLHLAVCHPCGAAFTITGVLDHLYKAHKGSYHWSTSERTEVKELLTGMGVLDQYPVYTASQVYSPFSGLSVVDGYGCTACFKNGSTQSSLMKHFKSEHPILPKPNAFPPSSGQYINRGATQILLRVDDTLFPPKSSFSMPSSLHSSNLSSTPILSHPFNSSSTLQSLQSSNHLSGPSSFHPFHSLSISHPLHSSESLSTPHIMHSSSSPSTPHPLQSSNLPFPIPSSIFPTPISSADQVKMLRSFQQTFTDLRKRRSIVPNARFISPFLLRTRWHELVSAIEDISELCILVAKPDTKDHPDLVATLQEYFGFCNSLLDQKVTNLLVLQQLNSDDPDKK